MLVEILAKRKLRLGEAKRDAKPVADIQNIIDAFDGQERAAFENDLKDAMAIGDAFVNFEAEFESYKVLVLVLVIARVLLILILILVLVLVLVLVY